MEREDLERELRDLLKTMERATGASEDAINEDWGLLLYLLGSECESMVRRTASITADGGIDDNLWAWYTKTAPTVAARMVGVYMYRVKPPGASLASIIGGPTYAYSCVRNGRLDTDIRLREGDHVVARHHELVFVHQVWREIARQNVIAARVGSMGNI